MFERKCKKCDNKSYKTKKRRKRLKFTQLPGLKELAWDQILDLEAITFSSTNPAERKKEKFKFKRTNKIDENNFYRWLDFKNGHSPLKKITDSSLSNVEFKHYLKKWGHNFVRKNKIKK